MNLRVSPCKAPPSYSLTRCITDSISAREGCRPQWDLWSDPAKPFCTDVAQLRRISLAFAELSEVEHNQIWSYTGCHLPCSYKEFRVVERQNSKSKENKFLRLIWSRKSVQVEKECLLYPFSSFLAEFGGALGLFVGFSFMVVWDLLESFYKKFFHKISMFGD